MKFIPINSITSVSASAEDATYIANWILETQKIQKVWKSSSSSGTLTFTIDGPSNCVALYNHNADTITVTVKDITETTVLEGPFVNDLSAYEYGNKCLWQEFDLTLGDYKVIVEAADGRENPVYCGVAWVGKMMEFSNPDEGLQFTWEDNSIDYELSSRSKYQVLKPLKKKFTGESLVDFKDADYLYGGDWLEINHRIKDYVGYKSVPWLIKDDNFTTHNIFGYISGFSRGRHSYADKSTYPLEIVEL